MQIKHLRLAALLASTGMSATASLAETAPAESVNASDTIVVTARRAATTARDEQHDALNLVNIQAAEDIVKYPDFNAAESLGRVPGVSLAIDTGEGRFVNIRGIDGNLNGTTFGGVTLLNTQPGGTYFGGGGRAVELDTIPIGSVDRLIVRKTGLPDQEAEGLGGSVEASPRTASGIKQPFAELTIGGGYQPAHKSGKVFRIEGAAGTRFGRTEQPWGIVLFGSYHEDHRGFDDLEAGYIDDLTIAPDKAFDSVDFRRYNYNRRRFGFGGELSFDPTPQSHYYIRATNAGYTESVNRQLLNLGNLGDQGANASLIDPANKNGFLAPAAGVALSLRDEQESHLNFVAAAGGSNVFGNGIKVEYQIAYTSSTYHRDYDYNSNFSSPSTFAARYDNTTNPDFPIFLTPGFDPNNTGQYTLSRLTNTTERAHDREYSGKLDVLVPTTLLGANGAFKIGAKVRLRDKIDQPLNFSYSAPATSLTQLVGPGPFNGFYGGRYAIGFSPDAGRLRTVFAGITPTSNLTRNASGFFNDTENVYAGYAQYEGKFGALGVLAGVRIERTEATYRGITTTNKTIFTPSSRTSSYTNAFPTVQLRYDISPTFVARVTYSTGIGRPGFLQLQSGARVDPGNLAVSVGNPDLRPTTSDAFDATLEYYLPNAGIISVGLFDKEFKDYVLSRISRTTSYPGLTGLVTVNSYSNVSKSHARGIEAAYTQKFTMLPAPFDGFGLTGNITYVDSKIEIRPGEFSLLPGTSKYTWNVGGFYEAHGLQLRLAAQHVSAAIFGVGGGAGFDVFQDARTTLDFTSSCDFNKHLQVYFNAKNLLNTPLRYYEGSANRPIQREFYEISYEAGVRLKL